MRKIIKRGLLAATAVAIPAGALLASPLAAHATAPTAIKGVVNNTGYQGTLNHTTDFGSTFKVDKYTLHVTGEYGWTNDFVLNVRTPVGADSSGAIVSGHVTDTTEYGSSTEYFSVDSAAWAASGNKIPFTAVAGPTNKTGQITVDPAGQSSDPAYVAFDPIAHAIFEAEYQMVYNTSGAQNAGYWLGN